jgi:hypothetical protein
VITKGRRRRRVRPVGVDYICCTDGNGGGGGGGGEEASERRASRELIFHRIIVDFSVIPT